MPEIVPIILAFVLGGVLGWLVGWLSSRRPVLPPDNSLASELRQQGERMGTELTETRRQFNQATAARAAAEAERDAAQRLLAETRELHNANLRAARETQEKALADLRDTFSALSAQALKQTAPQFLQLANETLAKFHESAKGDLAQRQQAIATLVEPLKEHLEAYQQRLQQSERAQATALGEVNKHLEGLAQQSLALARETQQFRMVLKSNQARGKWGEETLRRVVEAAGMSPYCDFTEQTQSDDKKPDMIVRLPGDRVIIIDSKVPDLVFLDSMDAGDAVERSQALSAHADRLKETIKELAKRDYPGQWPKALDYVVLFLPAESLFSAALEADRDLLIWAQQRKTILATPATLIGLLRAVSLSWQQHLQTENTREIAAAAQELFSRVVKFCEHFQNIRAGLAAANEAFNAAIGSYQRMVRPSGERLTKLSGNAAAKPLPEVQPLELALRLPEAATPAAAQSQIEN